MPAGYANALATTTTPGASVITNEVGNIALNSGGSSLADNFPTFKPVGSLSGYVYVDANNSGFMDSGEQGLAGVKVTVNGTGLAGDITSGLTTTTDSNGFYQFTNLPIGSYSVTESQPSGYIHGLESTNGGLIPNSTQTHVISGITVIANTDSPLNEFGEIVPASVSGTVYEDKDGSNSLTQGDVGIAGVTVVLTNTATPNQVIAVTTTDSLGNYHFNTDGSGNLLPPGTYVISEMPPSGYLQATDSVGTVNGVPDGQVLPTDQIQLITLGQGNNGVGYNFGEVKPVTFGGTIFFDQNQNSTQDAGEQGFAGLTVTLAGVNNLGAAVTATTTTAADGSYSFSSDLSGNPLAPGIYQLSDANVPAGYGNETATSTTAGARLAPTNVAGLALLSGQSSAANDFPAYKQFGSLSGYVFVDRNNDGFMEPGEGKVSGVVVTLNGVGLAGDVTSGLVATTSSQGLLPIHELAGRDLHRHRNATHQPDSRPELNERRAGSQHGDNVLNDIPGIVVNPNADSPNNEYGQIALRQAGWHGL